MQRLDNIKYSFLKTQISVLEIFKMLFSISLLSAGFSAIQSPDLGSFINILPIAFVAVGLSIYLHDVAHDVVASEYDVDTRFRIWIPGFALMIFSIFFGGLFAAFMSNEIEGETKEGGVIHLAGPVMSLILAVLFLQILRLGGSWELLGRFGAAISISIAAYNLLPMKPVDGYYIYKWNKVWWIVLLIPAFVIAAFALEGINI